MKVHASNYKITGFVADVAEAQVADIAQADIEALAQRLRALPVPIVGRIAANSLLLDLRCLEEKDEAEFGRQIDRLSDTPWVCALHPTKR